MNLLDLFYVFLAYAINDSVNCEFDDILVVPPLSETSVKDLV